MTKTALAPLEVRFGEFRFSELRRELRRGDLAIHLQPRVFDLLGCLLRHRDRPVAKEELLERVWSGVSVSEGVLTTALRLLRKGLGDDAKSPTYVKTVHGIGYRFVAQVVPLARNRATPTIDDARRARFVGRDSELRRLDEFLESDQSAFLVAGMAGIGKTTLIDEWTYRLRARGWSCLWLTGRQLSPVPSAILSALDRELERVDDQAVVVIDDYETLLPLDEWFRHTVLPLLAPRKLVVGCRGAVPEGWITDPAAHLLSTSDMRGLSSGEAEQILERGGIGPESSGRIAARVQGHPLCLHLLTCLLPEARRRLVATGDLDLPIVAAHFADEAPSDKHRVALEVASLLSDLDEAGLERLMGESCIQLFDWLASLPFVFLGPQGLRMHGAASSALRTRAAQTNPERFANLAEQAMRVAIERLMGASTLEERITCSAVSMGLVRVHPAFSALYDERAELLSVVLAEKPNQLGFIALAAKAHGRAAADVYERWLEEESTQLWVVKDPSGAVVGGTLVLFLSDSEGGEFDPAVVAIREHLASMDRAERPVIVHRAMLSVDGEPPGPVMQRCHDIPNINHHVLMPDPWTDSFLVFRHPEFWTPPALASDFQIAPGFQLSGTSFSMFHRSFDSGVGAWLNKVLEGMRQALEHLHGSRAGQD